MIIRFLIFGVIGWCMEIMWTGLGSLLRRDFRLVSNTSVWMFFIYGSAVFLEPLCDFMAARGFVLPVRGLIYTMCIFAAEYVTGSVLSFFNVCPWDYSGARFAVKGLIRLDYAPIWFAVGILFEFVHAKI